jgi:hypothetical protein
VNGVRCKKTRGVVLPNELASGNSYWAADTKIIAVKHC